MLQRAFQELHGRRVLVSGASSGLGAAAALAFGENGAVVAVHYNANRDGAEAIAGQILATGGQAHLIHSDLSLAGAGSALVDRAAGLLGGLDVLVNNAGDIFERVALGLVTDELL